MTVAVIQTDGKLEVTGWPVSLPGWSSLGRWSSIASHYINKQLLATHLWLDSRLHHTHWLGFS